MSDLRARLARVSAAARAADGPATLPQSGGPPSTSPARQAAGAVFDVRETRIPLDELGLEVVGRAAPDPLVLAHLGLRGEAPRKWEDVLFLDTETTGLMGGTGTYVFLVGTAHLADGELVVRQHVLRDLGAEREFVAALAEALEPFRACASYNGRTFDLPLLRTRFVLTRHAELTVDAAHLDLLHPSRRLWQGRFGSTTLRQLEESVLDDARYDDIPGSLIPERYFAYLSARDPDILAPVLLHNLRDLTSLVRITDRVALAVMAARAGRAPDHAPAALALARVFERTGEAEAAFCCYESAYADGDLELRVRCAIPFARALERRGDVDRAVRLLEVLVGLGCGSPHWREQAEGRLRRLMRKSSWRPALVPAT